MENPDKYVGHIVRLKPNVFQCLVEKTCRSGIPPDNCFLVATVSRRMRKLICYNSDLRVAVSISDVALV